MKRKVGDYATAAAAVILVMDGGTCRDARIALTNLADLPLFAEAAGQALIGTPVDGAASEKRGHRRGRDHRSGRGPARAGGVPQARRRRDDPTRAPARTRARQGG